MVRYRKRHQVLACSLAALAGYVDASGFLKLGGFFVSFMSGNSTRMSVGFVEKASDAGTAGAIIAAFVLGVIVGSLVGDFAKMWRRPAILLIVALLLGGSAALDRAGHVPLAIFLAILAMGAVNASFQRDGEVSIGLTYMTGTLVKLGQQLAGAMLGRKSSWLPYLILWLAMIAGAATGATLYPHLGFQGLWGASTVAGILCLVTAFMPQGSADG